MDDARVLEILAKADGSADVPRLGGMARPHGVFITSQVRWALAVVTGAVAEGAEGGGLHAVRLVPILRGLLRLTSALGPVFGRRGAGSGRERLVFAAALVLPLAFAFLPHLEATVLGALTAVLFLVWLFRGRTLY